MAASASARVRFGSSPSTATTKRSRATTPRGAALSGDRHHRRATSAPRRRLTVDLRRLARSLRSAAIGDAVESENWVPSFAEYPRERLSFPGGITAPFVLGHWGQSYDIVACRCDGNG